MKRERNHKCEILRYVFLAFISTLAVSYYFCLSSGSIFNILIWCTVIFFMKYCDKEGEGRKQNKCTLTFSILFSTMATLGKIGKSNETVLDVMRRNEDTIQKDSHTYLYFCNAYSTWQDKIILLIIFLGLTILFYYVLTLLSNRLQNLKIYAEGTTKSKKAFWIFWIVILVCWIPIYFLNFPGILQFDSVNQLQQIEGDVGLNNHHSVLSTILVAMIYQPLKTLTHSANVGIAGYTIIQMMIMALIEANVVYTLYRAGYKKIYVTFILVYFALSPVNVLYSMIVMQDILFSGSVLWLGTVLFQYFVLEEKNVGSSIQLIIAGGLMVLLRSNGIYAYFWVMVASFFFLKKDKKKIICFVIPIIIYILIVRGVYPTYNLQSSRDIIESLSIPMQHVARTVIECEDKLTEDEKELIERITSIDEMKEKYNCRFSDPIKILMWSENAAPMIEKNKAEYFGLWLRLGIKHPWQYIKAEVDATIGYWNPDVQYNTSILGVYPNDYGIHSIHGDKAIYAKAVNMYEVYRYVPLLGNLYSIGTMFWIQVFAIFLVIMEKGYKKIMVLLPGMGVWFTLMIATPLFSEMRYIYSVVLSAPAFFIMAIYNRDATPGPPLGMRPQERYMN